MSNSALSAILGSIVVSISACHAEDRGSIPRRGVVFFFSSLVSMLSVQWIGNSPTRFLFSHSSSSSFSPSKTMEISSSIFKLRCRHRFSIKSIFPLWSSSFTPPLLLLLLLLLILLPIPTALWMMLERNECNPHIILLLPLSSPFALGNRLEKEQWRCNGFWSLSLESCVEHIAHNEKKNCIGRESNPGRPRSA